MPPQNHINQSSVKIREFGDRSGVTTCFSKIPGLGCIVTVIGTPDSMRCVVNLMEMIINEEVDKRAACASLVSTNVESVMPSGPHPSTHPLITTNELPKAVPVTPIQSGASTPTPVCLMANQLREAVPTPSQPGVSTPIPNPAPTPTDIERVALLTILKQLTAVPATATSTTATTANHHGPETALVNVPQADAASPVTTDEVGSWRDRVNEDPSDRPDATGRVVIGKSGRPRFEIEPEAFKSMSREDRKILCRASNMRFMTDKGPAPRVKRRPYEQPKGQIRRIANSCPWKDDPTNTVVASSSTMPTRATETRPPPPPSDDTARKPPVLQTWPRQVRSTTVKLGQAE